VEDHPDPINELIRLYEIHKRSELLEAHARYARIYEEAGRTGLAEREEGLVGRMLEEALAEDGEEAEYLNNLAWFAATNDLFLERALLAAERAAALAPGEAYILDTLAEAQYRAGLVEEAIATIRKAIELDPESDYYRQQLERFRE
jgi:tetratricopeptide (TPR) repeat protein